MNNSIAKVKLGDVLDVKRGTSLSGDYFSETGKYIRLTLGNFCYPQCGWKKNTSKKDLYYVGSFRDDFLMKKGDIITPLTEQVRGLLGNTATIPEDDLYIQSGDIGKVIVNENVLDKRFAYYLLSSPAVKEQLAGSSQQTKIRHTSPDKIKECYAFMPKNIGEQKKIANFLDSINNKISLNNRINALLQKRVKLIYDYWFNQFDFPNEEGKPYKSSGGKMIWNEELKREIPESWACSKIGDCIKHINTGLNPRDNFVLNDGDIKYITVKNLTKEGNLNFDGCDTISSSTKEMINRRSMISKGDILFASIAPLGRCFFIQSDPTNWEINESVFSIRPDLNKVCTEYLYQFLISDYFVKKAEHSSTGSIFSGIRVSTLQSIPMLLPDKSVIDNYQKIVKDLFKYSDVLNEENLKLFSLRDFLLPLLMNGQVHITD